MSSKGLTAEECASQIVFNLGRLERSVAVRLRQGLSTIEISELELSIGLFIPQEAVELWNTSSGVHVVEGDILDEAHFFPGYYFLHLRDAVALALANRSRPDWKPYWLPVFANGGGDYYVLHLSVRREQSARVELFQVGLGEPEIGFKSLTSMLQCLLEAYDKGIFFVDKTAGYLEQNDALFWPLADRFG